MLYSVEGLRKDALLKKTAGNKIFVLDEAIEAYHNFSQDVGFDIFLSYRSLDADVAIALAKSFQHDFGYTVYLDRLIDPNLNPSSANKGTAECIRNRLRHCKCLVYANSINSDSSRWMPWEAGFMDGQNRPVAILPITQTERDAQRDTNKGLEYLSLYPYISKNPIKGSSEMTLWINESANKYCTFHGWLRNGKKPVYKS